MNHTKSSHRCNLVSGRQHKKLSHKASSPHRKPHRNIIITATSSHTINPEPLLAPRRTRRIVTTHPQPQTHRISRLHTQIKKTVQKFFAQSPPTSVFPHTANSFIFAPNLAQKSLFHTSTASTRPTSQHPLIKRRLRHQAHITLLQNHIQRRFFSSSSPSDLSGIIKQNDPQESEDWTLHFNSQFSDEIRRQSSGFKRAVEAESDDIQPQFTTEPIQNDKNDVAAYYSNYFASAQSINAPDDAVLQYEYDEYGNPLDHYDLQNLSYYDVNANAGPDEFALHFRTRGKVQMQERFSKLFTLDTKERQESIVKDYELTDLFAYIESIPVSPIWPQSLEVVYAAKMQVSDPAMVSIDEIKKQYQLDSAKAFLNVNGKSQQMSKLPSFEEGNVFSAEAGHNHVLQQDRQKEQTFIPHSPHSTNISTPQGIFPNDDDDDEFTMNLQLPEQFDYTDLSTVARILRHHIRRKPDSSHFSDRTQAPTQLSVTTFRNTSHLYSNLDPAVAQKIYLSSSKRFTNINSLEHMNLSLGLGRDLLALNIDQVTAIRTATLVMMMQNHEISTPAILAHMIDYIEGLRTNIYKPYEHCIGHELSFAKHTAGGEKEAAIAEDQHRRTVYYTLALTLMIEAFKQRRYGLVYSSFVLFQQHNLLPLIHNLKEHTLHDHVLNFYHDDDDDDDAVDSVYGDDIAMVPPQKDKNAKNQQQNPLLQKTSTDLFENPIVNPNNQSINDNPAEMALLNGNPLILQRSRDLHRVARNMAPIKHYMLALDAVRHYFKATINQRNLPAVYEGLPTSIDAIVRGGYRIARSLYNQKLFDVRSKLQYVLLPNLLQFFYTTRDVETFSFLLNYAKRMYEIDYATINSQPDSLIEVDEAVDHQKTTGLKHLQNRINTKSVAQTTHQLKKQQFEERQREGNGSSHNIDRFFAEEGQGVKISKNAFLTNNLQSALVPIVMKTFDLYLSNKDYHSAFNLLQWCEENNIDEDMNALSSSKLKNNKLFQLRTRLYAQSDDNTFFHFLFKLYYSGDLVGFKMNSFISSLFDAIPTIIPPSDSSSSKLALLGPARHNNSIFDTLIDDFGTEENVGDFSQAVSQPAQKSFDTDSNSFNYYVSQLRERGQSYSGFLQSILKLYSDEKIYLMTPEEQQQLLYTYDNHLASSEAGDGDNYKKYCILKLYNEINPNVLSYDEVTKRPTIIFPQPVTQKHVLNFHRVAHKIQHQALQIRSKIERYFPEFCAYPHYIAVDLDHDDVFGTGLANTVPDSNTTFQQQIATATNNKDNKKQLRELWVNALTPSMLNLLDDHEQFILREYAQIEPILQSSAIDNLPVGLKLPNRLGNNRSQGEINTHEAATSLDQTQISSHYTKIEQQLHLQREYNTVLTNSQLPGLSSSTIDPLVFRIQNEPISHKRSLFARFPQLMKIKDNIDSLDVELAQTANPNGKAGHKRDIFDSNSKSNEIKVTLFNNQLGDTNNLLLKKPQQQSSPTQSNTANTSSSTENKADQDQATAENDGDVTVPAKQKTNGKYRLFIHHDISILHAITEAAIDYKLRTAIPYFYTYNSQIMNHMMLNRLYTQLQGSYKSLMTLKCKNPIFTAYKRRFVNNSITKATKIIDDQYLKTLALINNEAPPISDITASGDEIPTDWEEFEEMTRPTSGAFIQTSPARSVKLAHTKEKKSFVSPLAQYEPQNGKQPEVLVGATSKAPQFLSLYEMNAYSRAKSEEDKEFDDLFNFFSNQAVSANDAILSSKRSQIYNLYQFNQNNTTDDHKLFTKSLFEQNSKLLSTTDHQNAMQQHAGNKQNEIRLSLKNAQATLNPRFLKYYSIVNSSGAKMGLDGNVLASMTSGRSQFDPQLQQYLVDSDNTTIKLKLPHFYHHDQTLVENAEDEVIQYSRKKNGVKVKSSKTTTLSSHNNYETQDDDEGENDETNNKRFINNQHSTHDAESDEYSTNIMTDITDDESSANHPNNLFNQKKELDSYTYLYGDDYDITEPINADEYNSYKQTLHNTSLNASDHVVFNSQIPFINRIFSILQFSQKLGTLPDRITYAILIQAARQRGCYELLTLLSNRQQLSALPYFAEHTAISTCYGLLECGHVNEAQQLIHTGIDLPTLSESTLLNLTISATQQGDTAIPIRLLYHSMRRNTLIFGKLKDLAQENAELQTLAKIKTKLQGRSETQHIATMDSTQQQELLAKVIAEVKREERDPAKQGPNNKTKPPPQKSTTQLDATLDLIQKKYSFQEISRINIPKLNAEVSSITNSINQLKDSTITYNAQYRIVSAVLKILVDDTLSSNTSGEPITAQNAHPAQNKDVATLLSQTITTSTQKKQLSQLSLEQQGKLNMALKLAFDLHKQLDFFYIPTDTTAAAQNAAASHNNTSRVNRLNLKYQHDAESAVNVIMNNTQQRGSVDRREINRLLLSVIKASWILGRSKPVSFFRTLITRNDPSFDHNHKQTQQKKQARSGKGGLSLNNFNFA